MRLSGKKFCKKNAFTRRPDICPAAAVFSKHTSKNDNFNVIFWLFSVNFLSDIILTIGQNEPILSTEMGLAPLRRNHSLPFPAQDMEHIVRRLFCDYILCLPGAFDLRLSGLQQAGGKGLSR